MEQCSACNQQFDLDDDGRIPQHTKPIVGQCCGSNLPPFTKTPQPHNKHLPDSKADFEVSLRWNRGQPGTGKRQ